MTAPTKPAFAEPLAHRSDFPLGIEEELLVVDGSGARLRADAEWLISSARPCDGRLTAEIFAGEIELVTPVCKTINEAARSLGALSSSVEEAGGTLLGAGLHPSAGVADYTYFWWEVRPHPMLGTVEVRAPDTQISLERTLSLAALIHALARMEAETAPRPDRSREAIEESCYQATRYGLEARLPDDVGERTPARALARETVRAVMPYARELGCADALEGIERIVREGNGADLQRDVYRRSGMSGLLEWLVRQRTGSAARRDGDRPFESHPIAA